MTDMTEGGRFKIWGFSDRMTDEQQADLESMQLDENDFRGIRSRATELAEIATNHRYRIFYYNYHIRRPAEGGECDVVFLDISANGVLVSQVCEQGMRDQIRNLNEEDLEGFMMRLGEAVTGTKSGVFQRSRF